MSAVATARAVLAGLYAGGVRDLVLSPGSRSTPLALAAWAADQARDMTLHVRIDERSAGFLALGLATGSRRPVAVLTTSGTAVGNLLPAVMEAHHTGRRIVVISADRPEHLRGTGANQTTHQDGLYGRFAPCTDLPTDTPADQASAAASRACRLGGPAQVNVQFDGQLVPDAGEPWWVRPEVADADRAGSAARFPSAQGTTDPPLRLRRGVRTLVIAGDDAGSAARLLAETAGWPLLAEPTSGARAGEHAIQAGRLLLQTSLREQIDRVIVIGHPTLSRPVTSLISDPSLEIVAVRAASGIATDPGRVATVVDTIPTVAADDNGGSDPGDAGWLQTWRHADRQLRAGLGTQIAAWSSELEPGLLHPLAVAAEVGAALDRAATLVVGPSSVVRDLDVAMAPYEPLGRRFVVGNRGLAGIDGMVSTAIGVALGRGNREPRAGLTALPPGGRTLAVLGDLTFLHDSNGLLIGPDEPRPDLTMVVVNDDGGAIFEILEQGAETNREAFERVFGTPTGIDIETLCTARRASYRRATSRAALREMLRRPAHGIDVIEVRASRATRRGEAAALAALARAVVDGGTA